MALDYADDDKYFLVFTLVKYIKEKDNEQQVIRQAQLDITISNAREKSGDDHAKDQCSYYSQRYFF